MLVNELGRFVAETRYGGLPAGVVEAVKLRILDLFAAGLVGYRVGAHARLLPLLGGRPQARVWGLGARLSVRDAVLANSFLAHSTYLDDGSRYTGGHPSSVVIPAAVALAEAQRAGGRDLIAAVAAGYEVFLRLGRAIYPSTVARGFQSTAVLGAVAAAAAASSILGFAAGRAKDALAIGCNLGVGLKEALKCSGSQPLQVARAAEGGVLAALFAAQGAAGADSIIEEGFAKAFADSAALGEVLAGLGARYRIFETYIKLHGGCRGNHAPVDVVQELARTHGIVAEEIEAIAIRVDSVTFAGEIHEPRTGEQAQFSVAFAVAVALLEGNASIFQYTDEKLADPRVRALMARIRVEPDRALDAGYPERRGAVAEIVLKDGRRYRGSIDNAKGEPEHPLSAAEIEEKFLTLAGPVLGARARRVRELVRGLEALDEVGRLTACLKSAPARRAPVERHAASRLAGH